VRLALSARCIGFIGRLWTAQLGAQAAVRRVEAARSIAGEAARDAQNTFSRIRDYGAKDQHVVAILKEVG
jgi:hypothetical protein